MIIHKEWAIFKGIYVGVGKFEIRSTKFETKSKKQKQKRLWPFHAAVHNIADDVEPDGGCSVKANELLDILNIFFFLG